MVEISELNGTPELMRAIGEALFGPRWLTDLADHFGINRRTVQRWLAGQVEPSARVWETLAEALSERAAEQRRLCAAIREHIQPEGNL